MLFGDETSLSRSVSAKLESLRHIDDGCFFVTIEYSLLTKKPHPIISNAFSAVSTGINDSCLLSSPILVAYERGFGSVSGLLRSQLEKSSELNVWFETIPFKSRKKSNGSSDSESEEDDLDGFVCKKPGCSRTFTHDHIEYVTEEQMTNEFSPNF